MGDHNLIFISYSRRDSAALARRLREDLIRRGFNAWLDTSEIAGGAVWSVEIEREIDRRNVTIALLSHGSYSSEICRAEHLRSLDMGKRVLPVLAVEGADRPIYLYTRQYVDFSNPQEYADRFEELLTSIESDESATLPERYRKTPIKFITAPPRVTNYINRPEAIVALRNAIFSEDHRAPVALTALAGMGGIGKTVLAKALTDDPVVQRAFPDGIVWITAGRERNQNFVADMTEIARVAGEDLDRCRDDEERKQIYRTLLADRAMLIVVDDVWSTADIQPLLAESPRSRFLFTTRDRSIPRFVSALEHLAELLDNSQARELLAKWAGVEIDQLPSVAGELISECGRLPLALSVIGPILRDSEPKFWPDTLELLKKADISAIEDQLPTGQTSFFRAVEVSFRALRPELQHHYRKLALLLEDTPAPLAVLQSLWGVGEGEARRIARQLVDRSLAHQEGEGLQLHDLQLDYLRASDSQQEALKLERSAYRLCLHIVDRDPRQFRGQMIGRLLSNSAVPGISKFIDELQSSTIDVSLMMSTPSLTQAGGALLWQYDFGSQVESLAVSENGGKLLIGTNNGRLVVASIYPDLCSSPQALKRYGDPVSTCALSANGATGICGTWDDQMELWDLASQTMLHSFSEGGGIVAMSSDGRRAISTAHNILSDQIGIVKLWDLEARVCLSSFVASSSKVDRLAFTSDGRCAIAVSGRTIKYWDVSTQACLHTIGWDSISEDDRKRFDLWMFYVDQVAVSADAKLLIVSCYPSDKVLIFGLNQEARLLSVFIHEDEVSCVALTLDAKLALTSDRKGKLYLWNMQSYHRLSLYEGDSTVIKAMSLTSNGTRAFYGGSSERAVMLDLRNRQLRPTTRIEAPGYMTKLVLGGSYGYSSKPNHSSMLVKWETMTGKIVQEVDVAEILPQVAFDYLGVMSRFDMTPDGTRCFMVINEKNIAIADFAGRPVVSVLIQLPHKITSLALSSGGDFGVTAEEGGRVAIWDIKNAREIKSIDTSDEEIRDVKISWDGRFVFCGVSKRSHKLRKRGGLLIEVESCLRLWDIQEEVTLLDVENLQGTISNILGHPSGTSVFYCCGNEVYYEELAQEDSNAEQTDIMKLESAPSAVSAAAISPDGKYIVAGRFNKNVTVWSYETKAIIAEFTIDNVPGTLAWTPSGILIIDDTLLLHHLVLQNPAKPS